MSIDTARDLVQLGPSEAGDLQPAVLASVLGLVPFEEALGSYVPEPHQRAFHRAPDCFLAVKRREKAREEESASAASTRAREIATLLTLSKSHYTGHVSGYRDRESAVNIAPVGISTHSVVSEEFRVVRASHRISATTWARKAEEYSFADIAGSLSTGSWLHLPGSGSAWSVYRNDPLQRVLLNQKRSSAQERVVGAAVQLYLAHLGSEPKDTLLRAVTALEMLFSGTTNFKLLERRLLALLPISGKDHAGLRSMLKLRHSFVHDGQDVSEQAAHFSLGLSSMVLHYFAHAIEKCGGVEQLEQHLDLVDHVRRMASPDGPIASAVEESVKRLQHDVTERWSRARASGQSPESAG